jgi:hypothetical protein
MILNSFSITYTESADAFSKEVNQHQCALIFEWENLEKTNQIFRSYSGVRNYCVPYLLTQDFLPVDKWIFTKLLSADKWNFLVKKTKMQKFKLYLIVNVKLIPLFVNPSLQCVKFICTPSATAQINLYFTMLFDPVWGLSLLLENKLGNWLYWVNQTVP